MKKITILLIFLFLVMNGLSFDILLAQQEDDDTVTVLRFDTPSTDQDSKEEKQESNTLENKKDIIQQPNSIQTKENDTMVDKTNEPSINKDKIQEENTTQNKTTTPRNKIGINIKGFIGLGKEKSHGSFHPIKSSYEAFNETYSGSVDTVSKFSFPQISLNISYLIPNTNLELGINYHYSAFKKIKMTSATGYMKNLLDLYESFQEDEDNNLPSLDKITVALRIRQVSLGALYTFDFNFPVKPYLGLNLLYITHVRSSYENISQYPEGMREELKDNEEALEKLYKKYFPKYAISATVGAKYSVNEQIDLFTQMSYEKTTEKTITIPPITGSFELSIFQFMFGVGTSI